MSKFNFPDTSPYLRGNFKPMRFEGMASFLEVEGELPEDFTGVYYLNTSCPRFPPTSKNYHWFAGDGKVHAFYFRGDQVVDYQTKWVRTRNFELEEQAQRALFGNKKYGSRMDIDPSVRHIRAQSANTNAIYHGGQLLALEDGNPPIALDPWSLDTIGAHTYNERLTGPMTAHPHVDPVDGSLVSFGRMVGGPGSKIMSHVVVNAEGELVCEEKFEAPYCALLHDFAISRNYVVYPLGPAILDFTRPQQGKPVLQWEGDRPSYLGVLNRAEGAKSLRWIEMDTCFMWHTLNAFERGDELCVDLVRYKKLPSYDTQEDVRSAANPEEYAGRLVRWSVDLSDPAASVREEILDDSISEFPRVDERVVGSEQRHAFFLCLLDKQGESRHWDAAVHLDLKTGRRQIYNPGANSFLSEAVFAPRPGSTEEGDGYVLVPVFRADENRSDLVILDALNYDAGPQAVIKLPFRMNPHFHGNFHALS